MKKSVILLSLVLQWGTSALAFESVPFDGGVFGGEEVRMGGNGFIDSYDSEKGPYGGTNIAEHGNIGSNDDIRLSGNVVVKGNATPGPAHQVFLTERARVTGSKDPASRVVVLGLIEEFTPGSQDLKVNSGKSRTLDEGEHRFKEVLVNGELILKGKVTLFCNSFSVSGRGKVQIEGEAEIFCKEDFEISGQGVFNGGGEMTGDATNAEVFVKGNDSKIVGEGRFYGVLYAPEREVLISGNGEAFGAVTGKRVMIEGNGKVHYDGALMRVRLIEEFTLEAPVQDFIIGQRGDGEFFPKAAILPDAIVFYDEEMNETKRITFTHAHNLAVSEDGRFIATSEVIEVDPEKFDVEKGKFIMYNTDGDPLWSADLWIDGFMYILDNGNTLLFNHEEQGFSALLNSQGVIKRGEFGAILAVEERNFVNPEVKKFDLFGNLIWENHAPTATETQGVGISPDGTYISATYIVRNIIKIRILDGTSGAELFEFQVTPRGTYEFVFSADSRIMVTTSQRTGVWCVDMETRKVKWTYFDPEINRWFGPAAVNRDGSRILVGADTGPVNNPGRLPQFLYLFDGNGKVIWKEEVSNSFLRFVDPDVKRFFVSEGDKVFYYRIGG